MADLDALFEQFYRDVKQALARAATAEYQRGEKDAIARIMKAAQSAPEQPDSAHLPPVARALAQKERAPEGAAEALIDRVLRERGPRGASPTEIAEAAQTATEKLVSYSGIRFRLEQGREQQKYRNKEGKWFLRVRLEPASNELPGTDSR